MRPNLSRLRASGPWLLRDALRVGLVLILAAVSAFYLTRWGLHNKIPAALAWTLPAAFDCSALLGIVVAQHPRDAAAKVKAVRFAWAAAGLSAAGNGAMHAVDFGALHVNLWTVIATGAVYPVLLAWGYEIAGGMAARPAMAVEVQPFLPSEDEPAFPPTRTARVQPDPGPSATEPPPVPAEVPEGEPVRVMSYDEAVAWAARESAGAKRIQSHCGLSEHYAKNAARDAKAARALRVAR